jgi:hypothetical protein
MRLAPIALFFKSDPNFASQEVDTRFVLCSLYKLQLVILQEQHMAIRFALMPADITLVFS